MKDTIDNLIDKKAIYGLSFEPAFQKGNPFLKSCVDEYIFKHIEKFDEDREHNLTMP